MPKTKPAGFAKAVTLSDTINIDFEGTAHATRALYVGSGGDISVEMAGRDEKGGGLSPPLPVLMRSSRAVVFSKPISAGDLVSSSSFSTARSFGSRSLSSRFPRPSAR